MSVFGSSSNSLEILESLVKSHFSWLMGRFVIQGRNFLKTSMLPASPSLLGCCGLWCACHILWVGLLIFVRNYLRYTERYKTNTVKSHDPLSSIRNKKITYKFEAFLYYPQSHLPRLLRVISILNHMLFILKHLFVKWVHSIDLNVYTLFMRYFAHFFLYFSFSTAIYMKIHPHW